MSKGPKKHSANYWRKKIFREMLAIQQAKKLCDNMSPKMGASIFNTLLSAHIQEIEKCQTELAKLAIPLST